MDQQTITIVIIGVLVVFLIWTYLRRKSTGSPKVDAVEGILKDIAENTLVMEERLTNPQSTRKFQISNWKRFNNKLGFLGELELASVNEVYALMMEYNRQIELARKNHNLAALQEVQVEKLKEPLNKSKNGLSDWLRTNRRKELETGNRGGFGDFFR
jgi:regulatory protein YycI of two-component signal transduction system YycFG